MIFFIIEFPFCDKTEIEHWIFIVTSISDEQWKLFSMSWVFFLAFCFHYLAAIFVVVFFDYSLERMGICSHFNISCWLNIQVEILE